VIMNVGSWLLLAISMKDGLTPASPPSLSNAHRWGSRSNGVTWQRTPGYAPSRPPLQSPGGPGRACHPKPLSRTFVGYDGQGDDREQNDDHV